MSFVFHKMDLPAARQIISWSYPPPYEFYSLNNSPMALAKLLDDHYFAVFFGKTLIGFFCYGLAAQLSTKRSHELYQDQDFLDIGLGLHPNYCDRGQGYNFVRSGLAYARKRKWSGGFRLTVASNNSRALNVYSKLGFQKIGEISWDRTLIDCFWVLTLNNFPQDSITDQLD